MATASIIEAVSGSGAWGSYGTAGWSILAATRNESLPPFLTGVIVAGEGGLGSWDYPVGDDRCMRDQTGAKYKTTYGRTDSSPFEYLFKAATEATPWTASIRLAAAAAGRPANVTVTTYDKATTLATTTTGDLFDGVWLRIAAVGSIAVSVVGTFPRSQGAIYDPGALAALGRLLCLETGRSGLIA